MYNCDDVNIVPGLKNVLGMLLKKDEAETKQIRIFLILKTKLYVYKLILKN